MAKCTSLYNGPRSSRTELKIWLISLGSPPKAPPQLSQVFKIYLIIEIYILYIYIMIHVLCVYMLSCSVLTSPPPTPMVWSPRPWAPAQRPTIRLCKAACLPYLPLFPHLVKFLENTMQFNTTCEGYDSINQHSHQSTPTTGPQGGGGQTMTMPGAEERRWSIYIIYLS